MEPQAALELPILLPQLPDYRNTPSPAGCLFSYPVPLSYIQPLVKFGRTSEPPAGTPWVPHQDACSETSQPASHQHLEIPASNKFLEAGRSPTTHILTSGSPLTF